MGNNERLLLTTPEHFTGDNGVVLPPVGDDGDVKKHENRIGNLEATFEINRYLSTHTPDYLQALNALRKQDGQPINQDCKMQICIPAFQEAKNIRRTLNGFVDQVGVRPEYFAINVLNNHRLGEVSDNLIEEINVFKAEHPNFQINAYYGVFPMDHAFGYVRKVLFDLALLKFQQRYGNQNVGILVSADADSYGFSPSYLRGMIEESEWSGNVDMLVGSFKYPAEALKKYPLLAASFMFHRRFRDKKEDLNYVPWACGRTMAFTSTIYTRIGGWDGTIKRSSDVEFGRRVAVLRGLDAPRHIKRYTGEVVTDPRRALAKMALPDKALTNEFEDIDWTRDERVSGKHWEMYSLPELEVVDTGGLEKELGATLIKKAYRDGAIKCMENMDDEDVVGVRNWLEARRDVITEIFHSMGMHQFEFAPEREVVVNSKRIPRVIVLGDLSGIRTFLAQQ